MFFILLLAFGCQRTTVNGQQTLCTVPEPVEGTASGASTSSATAYPMTVGCCPLSVDYYEKQIHIADSLYKNYLPQSNFEEVKKAMEFFDSLQLSKTTDNRQRTTDFFHRIFSNRKQKDLSTVPEPVEGTTFGASTSSATSFPRTVDCCPLSVDFICAKAHYYHAVGLTEKDDIVGACEHYLTALEIMEFETENLRTSKSESILANGKRLKSKGKGKEKTYGSQLEAHSSKKSVDRCLLTVDNPEDYEKIRFIALTYIRLGRLFYNEGYCDLAILKYKKALRFVELIKDTASKANVLKELGNSYQLYGQNDSALFYYNRSLMTNQDESNYLDIQKCIAKILFDKGKKDSAYILIKNNLDKIENTNVRCSYYNILGEMYVKDKEYDSAVYYLTKSINSNISDIKVNSAIKLSAIYDSIGDYEKKVYYNEIISKISINDVNKSLKNNKIQDVYDKYKERKAEKEKIKSRTRTKVIAISLSLLIIISFVIIILIWHKSKRKNRLHQESLNEKDRCIANKEEIISRTNEEIKRKESEIKKLVEIIESLKSDINSLKHDVAIKEEEISDKETDIKKMENDLLAKEMELKRFQANVYENSIVIEKFKEDCKTNEELMAVYLDEIEKLKTEISETQKNLIDLRFKNSFTEGKIKNQNAELKKKEELIGKYTTEISNLKYRSERNHVDISNLNNYLQSDICSKILNDINEISDKKLKSNMLSPLSKKEFVLLLNSANHHLNYFINDMAKKYQKLKKEDLYYLCLVIMGLNNNQISSLFGVTYDTIQKRKNKICVILGLDPKENLYNYILRLI